MKKFILLFLSLITQSFLFSNPLSGYWVREQDFENYENQWEFPDENHFHEMEGVWVSGTYEGNGVLLLIDDKGSGYINSFSTVTGDIERISGNEKRGSYQLRDTVIEITVMGEDLINIKVPENFTGGFLPSSLYKRMSRPSSLIPFTAVINDDHVRLRSKGNLDCHTWGKLFKGEEVVVKEVSKEKEEIDGEEYNWYRVNAKGYPEGWVYGKYLTLSSDANQYKIDDFTVTNTKSYTSADVREGSIEYILKGVYLITDKDKKLKEKEVNGIKEIITSYFMNKEINREEGWSLPFPFDHTYLLDKKTELQNIQSLIDNKRYKVTLSIEKMYGKRGDKFTPYGIISRIYTAHYDKASNPDYSTNKNTKTVYITGNFDMRSISHTGVKIGMKKEDFLSAMGKEGKKTGDALVYEEGEYMAWFFFSDEEKLIKIMITKD